MYYFAMGQMKPFALIFFVVVMVWVGSIFVSGTPRDRIDASCQPIPLVGKFFTSVGALVSSEVERGVAAFFTDRTYDCRYVLWRQFYEDDYQRLMAAERERQAQLAGAQKKPAGAAPAGRSAISGTAQQAEAPVK